MKLTPQEIKDRINIVDIVKRYVDVEKKGDEYHALCPFHEDTDPSLRVNNNKGFFRCFGCGKSGDVFNFIMFIESVSFQRAKEIVAGDITTEIKTREGKTVIKEKFKKVYPITQEHTKLLPKDISGVKIIEYYEYRNAKDEILGYHIRLSKEKNTGKKRPILPLSLVSCGNAIQWKTAGFGHHLYGMEDMVKHPKAAIIVVEGERCRDDLKLVIGEQNNIIVVGTASSTHIKKTDLTLFAGRNIVCWPDADSQRYGYGERKGELVPAIEQPGIALMVYISKTVSANAKLIVPDKSRVNGWDVSDAIRVNKWDRNKILSYIKENTRGFDYLYQKEGGVKVGRPFQCLGYSSTHGKPIYHYLPNGTSSTVSLSPIGHNKMSLLSLAPLEYWEQEYPGRILPNFFYASNDLMRECEKRGLFDPLKIRGRGAWFDKNRTILHLGDNIIIDGKSRKPYDIDSKFIYEVGLPLEGGASSSPLQKKEAGRLVDICELMSWENKLSAKLLSGWLFLACICGAIRWRPHVWMTGEGGTGKSWIMDRVISKVLGNFSIDLVGQTTEAGMRGLIGNDAIPICLDEADSNNRDSFKVMEKNIELARCASSNTRARIVKGTADGGTISWCIRSMFLFSSVVAKLTARSDEDRFSILRLTKRDDYTDSNDFVLLKRIVKNELTREWAAGLRARAVRMIPIIRENIDLFSRSVAMRIKNVRQGDQIGALLAGCAALRSDTVIKKSTIEAYVNKIDWHVELSMSDTTDQEKLMRTICERVVKDKRIEEVSVGCLIRRAIWKQKVPFDPDEDDARQELNKSDAIMTLGNYGMGIIKSKAFDKKGDNIIEIVFAKNHSKLGELLQGTPWRTGYDIVLERYKGATLKQRIIENFRYRCIAIPSNNILIDRDCEDKRVDDFF